MLKHRYEEYMQSEMDKVNINEYYNYGPLGIIGFIFMIFPILAFFHWLPSVIVALSCAIFNYGWLKNILLYFLIYTLMLAISRAPSGQGSNEKSEQVKIIEKHHYHTNSRPNFEYPWYLNNYSWWFKK